MMTCDNNNNDDTGDDSAETWRVLVDEAVVAKYLIHGATKWSCHPTSLCPCGDPKVNPTCTHSPKSDPPNLYVPRFT